MKCPFCTREAGNKLTCGHRTCQNKRWRQENEEAYAAARERYNQKRRELRKTNRRYGRRTHPRPLKLPGDWRAAIIEKYGVKK